MAGVNIALAQAESPAAEVYRLRTSRYDAEYIVTERWVRGKRMNSWKTDILNLRAVEDGRWADVYGPDYEANKRNYHLRIQNIVVDAWRDHARRAAEAVPTIMCGGVGRALTAEAASQKQKAIAQGYAIANRDNRKLLQLALEVAGFGGAFVQHFTRDGDPYPRHRRLDPVGVLPSLDIEEEELLDLLYVKRLPLDVALHRWRDTLNEQGYMAFEASYEPYATCEFLEYFTDDEVTRCLSIPGLARKGRRGDPVYRGFLVDAWRNPTGRPTVSWCKLATGDGAWRGLFNQTGTIVDTMNQLVGLALASAEQMAAAPIKAQGALNPEDFGPFAVIRADRSGQPFVVERVQAQQLPAGFFGILNQLSEAARGSAAFPAARQGETGNLNIASGSLLTVAQGQEVSAVGEIEATLGALRERGTEIDMALDRQVLDFTKPLLAPSGDEREYSPIVDIPERPIVQVTYGPGSGMNRYDTGVAVQQKISTLMLSQRTGRTLDPDVLDPDGEEDQVAREQTTKFFFQGQLAQSLQSPEAALAMMQAQIRGERIENVIVAALEEEVKQRAMQAQQQQQAAMAQAGAAQPPQEGLPPAGYEGQPSLAPGGAAQGAGPQPPGLPAPQVQLPAPAYTNVVVK